MLHKKYTPVFLGKIRGVPLRLCKCYPQVFGQKKGNTPTLSGKLRTPHGEFPRYQVGHHIGVSSSAPRSCVENMCSISVGTSCNAWSPRKRWFSWYLATSP